MRHYYDHVEVAQLREDGLSWRDVAFELRGDGSALAAKQVRQAHQAHLRKFGEPGESPDGARVVQEWRRGPEGTLHLRYPDPDPLTEEDSKDFWSEAMETFKAWQPRKEPPPTRTPSGDALGVISLYDAHFGMKADIEETGKPSQDLDIISADFDRAAASLISLSGIYAIGRYLIPLGHDFSHVNQYMGKALTTRNGTEQDVDTRLWKIHQAVCQSSVRMIDLARSTGKKVDVVMVPGNHDPDENFKLGEYLQAWYRFDDGVTITNTPTIHKYYGWRNNAFMLTHGENYLKKNAGNPILTFAAECPPEIWARGYAGARYILSGHFHARRKGQYTPTSDVTEEKAVITYVLPGLTSTDEWHQRMGYQHHRAGTLQVFQASGGLLGHHEVTP
jgi:hypothetical protein